ncbi:MAG: hypothetical protein A2W23_06360 [Planctomycetes bacterium RBG_16_43_13]|nr:MAG: hypothetical protein A2W23_06360 [Planctomycetes bacterium RBG_16_43_13]
MEENKATGGLADDATVTEPSVTDEALTAALEGKETSGPEVTAKAAEAEPEGQDEDKEDHADKTRLGRKVKKLEDVMVTKTEFSQLMNKLDTFMTKPAEQVSTEKIDIPEYVATPEDVEKVIQARERRIQADQETYQKAYVSTMVSIGNGNEQHDEVVKEMMTNFNVRRTGNPQIDAELNYAKAQAAVLSRGATKTVPVKGDKPVAAGVTVGSTNTQRKVTLPKLSAEAENFVAYMRRQGMTDESIAEALKE